MAMHPVVEDLPQVVEHPVRVDDPPPQLKVAYTMSRFPKLTETFILYEILALEKIGVQVELFPLLRERQSVIHPEAEKMLDRAQFYPFISMPILLANLQYMIRKPATYSRMLFDVLRWTFGSLNFFVGAIGILPKSVKMALEMQKRGVTHLHAHFCTHPALAALIIHRLTGITYSFTAHGSDVHVERRMIDKKVDESAFAVSVSQFNRKVILDDCPPRLADKLKVVHCGVDVDQFSPPVKRAKKKMYDIVCVASFEEVKGHKYLVEACKILADRKIRFRCRLVGYGPLKNKIKSYIKDLGLGSSILVYEPLPRKEVIRMYAQADVKVLASVLTKEGKKEGVPVVLMEAMAMKLPVVSSLLSGIPELVEDGITGILVPPRDVNGLADALEKLLTDDKLRQKMGAAGRKKVEREFNLKKNADKLSQLFIKNLTNGAGWRV